MTSGLKQHTVRRNIQNPVKQLRWSLDEQIRRFLAINYFRKKASSYIFDRVLNTPKRLVFETFLLKSESLPKN